MDASAASTPARNEHRAASALARRAVTTLVRERPNATASWLLAACAVAAAAVLWTPLRLPAAVANVAVVLVGYAVTWRNRRALRVALLPYTRGLVDLFGAEAAARLLVVATGRSAGNDPMDALLIGLASTLRAVRDADCADGHLAGCRHRPVSRQVLLSCPRGLVAIVVSAVPVAG